MDIFGKHLFLSSNTNVKKEKQKKHIKCPDVIFDHTKP